MVSQRRASDRSSPTPARRNGAKKNGVAGAGLRDALIEGLSAPTGEHFFRTIARSLAVALDARFGFVTEIADKPASLKVLAFWTGEEFGENFTYPVKGTPCERVLGKQFVSIEKGVQKAYPEDAWLAEIGAESYLAVPLLDSDGSALGHLGVLNDAPLDASQEAVAVLQAFATRAAGELRSADEHAETERKLDGLEAIMSNAAVGILQIDRDGKIVFANPRVETLFGYKRNELLGRPVEQLMPSHLHHRHREHRKLFMRDPHDRPMGENLDTVGRQKDGSKFPVAIALSGDGRGATAFITDATKIKQTTGRLEGSERRLQAVLQALPDLTFILDRKGVYRDFAAADGLDPYVPPGEFLGKSVSDVLPEELAAQTLECVKRALKTRKVQQLKYELTLPDGTHSYEARIVRLDSDRVAVFARDLTAEEWRSEEMNRRETRSGLGDEIERRMEWRNPYGLSYREFSVLHVLKGGTTDKEIANDLGISVFTVNKHVSNILTKMNAASRTEATIRALQEGLID